MASAGQAKVRPVAVSQNIRLSDAQHLLGFFFALRRTLPR